MIYITDFLFGVFFVLSWSIFFYLIKPSTFFITINNNELSRGKVLLYWLIFNLFVFILFCLFITDKPKEPSLMMIFIGFFATLIGLFYGAKNKINIRNESKKIIEEPEKHSQIRNEKKLDNNSAYYRYELDYKDRFGNITTRFIHVTAVQKELNNNRWYFLADTPNGERTFKSERVLELRDNWTGDVFNSSRAVREHIIKNYPETDSAFD